MATSIKSKFKPRCKNCEVWRGTPAETMYVQINCFTEVREESCKAHSFSLRLAKVSLSMSLRIFSVDAASSSCTDVSVSFVSSTGTSFPAMFATRHLYAVMGLPLLNILPLQYSALQAIACWSTKRQIVAWLPRRRKLSGRVFQAAVIRVTTPDIKQKGTMLLPHYDGNFCVVSERMRIVSADIRRALRIRCGDTDR